MTKKIFLLFALAVVLGTQVAVSSLEEELLTFIIKPTDPGDIHSLPTKAPVQFPVVYLTGNVLSFDSAIEGCTIQLLDESETVVFSDFIGENQTSLVLPSTLSGTYELQIVCGNIIFYAIIEL